MFNRKHITHATALLVALGCFLAGIFADGRVDREDIRLVGIGLGVTVLVVTVNRCALRRRISLLDDVAEQGQRVGYSRGFQEGRERARPVVVHTVCPDCGGQMRRTG